MLMRQFHTRQVKKQYIAIVQGRLPRKEGEIRIPIKDFDQKKFNRRSPAKLAITHYRLLAYQGELSIVEVHPVTGRTNQIRIHLSQIGFPILGDRKYSVGRLFTVPLRRTALHAQQIIWFHPYLRQYIKVKAPVPDDMQKIISGN